MMKLLVSVRDGVEAAAARAGGADIIDAKEPSSGALGSVDLATFQRIVAVVAHTRPVTAALGDAVDERAIEALAHAYVSAGATLVKIGFAGIASRTRVLSLLAAARDGAATQAARTGAVIATAYADADRVAGLNPFAMIDTAASAGATGILLDTADKHGPGLLGLLSPQRLNAWVCAARDARLLVALAGKLTRDDVDCVRDAGADIVGVRGAACDSGRTGQVATARVRALRSVVARRSARAPVPDPVSAFE